jgi:hypothetical protein
MITVKPILVRSFILGLVLIILVAIPTFLIAAPGGGRSTLASPGDVQAISTAQWAAIQGANQLLLQPNINSIVYLPVVER